MLNPFLYYRTIRHLKASQIYWRLRNKALSRIEALSVVRRIYEKESPVREPATLKLRNPWRENPEERKWLGEFRFKFLNREVDTKGTWFPKGASQLWLFNLHYHQFLFGLPKGEICRLITSWLDSVPAAHRTAWHPFVISERICAWVWVLSPIWNELDEAFRERVINSIYNQARYLKRYPERDLLANHLLVDAKGLVIAGLFLGIDQLVEEGLAVYQEQLPEQILSDGGHFERSPMYHSLVLEDLLAVAYALGTTESRAGEAEKFLPYIEKMGRFLAVICVGDEIPLLNDSVHGVALTPSTLIKEVEELCDCSLKPSSGWTALEETGLYIYRGEPLSVLFDAGPLGPEYQMGHGHNDTLQFLVWVDGKPFITDTGVYGYEEGEERDYCRSARAHNVVWVPPHEPNEIWGSFRVGRRAKIPSVVWDRPANCFEARSVVCQSAMARRITAKSGALIEVKDTATSCFGLPEGKLLFDPNVHLSLHGSTWRCSRNSKRSAEIRWSARDTAELSSAKSFCQFGKGNDRRALTYKLNRGEVEFQICCSTAEESQCNERA